MIAWIDCTSGISGDKLLAALLDAGAPRDAVREALARLPLTGWALRLSRAERGGVGGMRACVEVTGDQPSRTWRDIQAMVSGRAFQVFEYIAEAEACVHGVDVENVHFHEVGAVDSIIDIVGCCAAVEALGIDRVLCSPVAVGGGTVETEHGTLPVPAPATALLLGGVPIVGGPAEHGELTTPTGAALALALADEFGPMPEMTLREVGHGAGTREVPGLPNVLRVFVGDAIDEAGDEEVVLLETNVDHLSPELLSIALEALRAGGALDVWQTPVLMKKGRAAFAVSVMAAPADEERLVGLLMEQTGTLGVRRRTTRRWVAERDTAEVATSLGRVRVKIAAGRMRPEADDVAWIARASGAAPGEVARTIVSEGEAAE